MIDYKDFNWGMILILLMTVSFWSSVWFNGFFITLCWLIILSAIIGLWLRLSGRM